MSLTTLVQEIVKGIPAIINVFMFLKSLFSVVGEDIFMYLLKIN